MLYKLITFLFLVLFFVLTGCGPKTTTVTGTVTLNGKGLQDISVLLQPVSGSGTVTEAAFGKTDQQGQFFLTLLFSKKRGVLPGEYLVYINWVDPNPKPENEPQNPCPYNIPLAVTNGSIRQCIEVGHSQRLDFELSRF
ncbi:MAG: hypothetical protein LBC02_01770 [Planctomycetaceae bacterium]|jgi:hypothetical protein|nr:hypothetical protein [Planctomycetaceae bacterium]